MRLLRENAEREEDKTLSPEAFYHLEGREEAYT